jgi:enoyl-CoA hydratase/carnithine racemase
MNEAVGYTKKEHVGRIVLNRALLDLEMAQALADISGQVNGDEEIYVVVLSSSGSDFCTGGDKRQLIIASEDQHLPLKLSPADAVASIEVPTLASIGGDALGMGLELALACDLRIASDSASFGLPQITQGHLPMDGGTQRLSRVIGRGKALEMVLTGESISSGEALEVGLVNRIFSREKLSSETETMAKLIAGKAPISLRYCKEAVNKGLDLTLEQGLRLEADLYFLLHTTSDRTEGIRSFLAKKPPEYRAR